MNMKKIYYILALAVLAVAASCQKPQYVLPTAERQGITSLTAYFTSGKFVDKEMGKLEVADPNTDRYEIPIPWFYPEESDSQTKFYMTKVRVRAELAPNCKIDPPLTILDLTQEHEFTYTDAQGGSKRIIITGKRVKSSTAQPLSFNILEERQTVAVEGFIDNEKKIIYLLTTDDLDGFTAEAEPWYHASIENEEALATPKNWNNEQTVTFVAHDGVTKVAYKVMKRTPVKISYGFDKNSYKPLFNIDPVAHLNFPAYNDLVNPSLAYVDGNLVVCHGPDAAPVYLDARNGSKKGTIATGGRTYGAVTNDEGGNILLCNRLDENGGTLEIYRTSSVTETPVLFHSYSSEVSLPIGTKIKVCGDIDANARITLSYEGIQSVTTSGQFLEIVIEGGVVKSETVYDVYASAGLCWPDSPVGAAGLVPTSSEAGVNGWYFAQYVHAYTNPSFNGLCWIKPNGTRGHVLTGKDSNYNHSWLDSKKYNTANYLAFMVAPHYPGWGGSPSIYVFDIADPSTISGDYTKTSYLVVSGDVENYNLNNGPDNETKTSGDIVIAQSADGFKMYIYYYDHFAGVIGGVSADCIDKTAL